MTAGAFVLTAVAAAFIGIPCLALLLNVRSADVWAALGNQWVLEALGLSLRTSLVATVICVLLGSPAAYLLARIEFPGKRFVDSLLQLPLVIPPIVAGVALLMAFGRRGLLGHALMVAGLRIPFTSVAVVLAQVFMGLPLLVQAARAGFKVVPRSVEEASQTLGASQLRTFLRVTIPMSWPALVSGAILCWGRSMGEFGATIMFAGNMRGTTRTMPLAILTAMQGDIDAALVLAVMLMLISAVMFVGARWALGGVGNAA